MLKRGLTKVNLAIGILAISLLLFSTLLSFHPITISTSDIANIKRPLPKSFFEMSQEAYASIGNTCLCLKYAPYSIQLPDLRNHLVYFGKNGRPDAQSDKTVMHFGFTGSNQLASVSAKEKLHIFYDRSRTPGQYQFSPENQPTSLWIEAESRGNEAVIHVRMLNEQNEVIQEPIAYAELILAEKENNSRAIGKTWEMGKWRVDGSLLARQKASWKGIDRFLERHGGEEFQAILNKHRIDFTYDEIAYSVFVGVNDNLIWDGNQWKTVQAGENSLEFPLMIVKKIDERLMNLELWDIGGKNKIILNLIRINEPWAPQTLQDSFHCLGARTRSQYIFEIDAQRILLRPNDWLLKTEEGWAKIETPEEIDEYVERKKTGLLFVFDGLTRVEGCQMLSGVIFNAPRTEMHEIQIPVQTTAVKNMQKEDEGFDEDDDDDDDDEEDDDFDDDDDDETPTIKLQHS